MRLINGTDLTVRIAMIAKTRNRISLQIGLRTVVLLKGIVDMQLIRIPDLGGKVASILIDTYWAW